MGCFQSNNCLNQGRADGEVNIENKDPKGGALFRRPQNKKEEAPIYIRDYLEQAPDLGKINDMRGSNTTEPGRTKVF
jgi:hypothetical protein